MNKNKIKFEKPTKKFGHFTQELEFNSQWLGNTLWQQGTWSFLVDAALSLNWHQGIT